MLRGRLGGGRLLGRGERRLRGEICQNGLFLVVLMKRSPRGVMPVAVATAFIFAMIPLIWAYGVFMLNSADGTFPRFNIRME